MDFAGEIMEIMKLAFIGTHGIGKTTLAHDLYVKLKKSSKHVLVLEEVAGTCPLPINHETSQQSQEWIIFTQLTREIELEHRLRKSKSKDCGILVCDRSVLDDYTYYVNALGHDAILRQLVERKISEYALLFKVPINPAYRDEDGIRSVDVEFQMKIDQKMDELIKEMNVSARPYETLDRCMELILEKQNSYKR